jgi:hypothetical protein
MLENSVSLTGAEERSYNGILSTSSSNNSKIMRLQSVLRNPLIDISTLREIAWSGFPSGESELRAICWKLLLGYLPLRLDRHTDFTRRKRAEYAALLDESNISAAAESSSADDAPLDVLKQIRLDIPRTHSFSDELSPVVAHPLMQSLMERVLFIWSQRNKASSYVQGMNDITVPLLAVLLSPIARDRNDSSVIDSLSPKELLELESELYWMFSRLLQDLQDNYTPGQYGIQRMVQKVEAILRRTNPELICHLETEQVSLLQITFRWFNCLLSRELRLHVLLRCYDALLSDEAGFSEFLVYVCTALLKHLSAELCGRDFQGIMTLMTSASGSLSLDVPGMDAVLAEAFVLKSLFHQSRSI